MKNTVQNTRNLLYARFSDSEQAAGDSEDNQIRQATAWCQARGEILSTPYFIDRGVSADVGANRDKGTEFHKLMQTVKAGDRVLIRDNDRFGRDNVLKALGHLQQIVEEKKISFVILSTGVEVNQENFNRPEILFPNFFKGFLAFEENQKKKDNINKALAARKEKIVEGEIIRKNRTGGNIQDVPVWVDSATWKVNKIAEIVVTIFTDYLNNIGPAAIARKLNADKIPNFGRGKKAGKAWSQSVIYRLLSDHRTCGYYNNGKGEYVANYYPAAVDKDTFSKATSRRNNNRGKVTIARGDKAIVNLFTGLFRCTCGGAMRVCKTYIYCHEALKGLPCKNTGTINYDMFEDAFTFILRLNPSQLVQDQDGNGVNTNTQILNGRYADNQKQIDNITAMILKGICSEATARTQVALEATQKEIKTQIEIEAAKTVASVGSVERIAEIRASLGTLKTDQNFRARVQAWIRENINSVTLDKSRKEFVVDLKSGKCITMGLDKSILGMKSYENLFELNKAIKPQAIAQAS